MNVPTCCQNQDLDQVGYDIYPDIEEGVVETYQYICENCKTRIDRMIFMESGKMKWVKYKKE
jgi:hypothetical protein